MVPTDDELRGMLDGLLSDVYTASHQRQLPRITTFIPRRGSRYSGGMMLIGRAVNGWKEHEFTFDDVSDDELRSLYLDRVLRFEADHDCTMRWVADHWPRPKGSYSTSRSAFWRVAKKVATRLPGIEGDEWPSHLAWTNLYKVAPAAGGNPDTNLRQAQLQSCRRLLRWEIERLQPKVILALTGWDWFKEFADTLGAKIEVFEGRLVEGSGIVADSQIVIAKHPQGKPERQLVHDILEILVPAG